MFGISNSGKEALNQIVADMFDRIAMQFIGDLPQFKNKKNLFITGKRDMGLADLFVQSMKNRVPNEIEADVLKSLLVTSNGYIEALKNTTTSNLTDRIDGLAREANVKQEKMDEAQIEFVISEEMGKARSKMEAIIEAESTKLRNLGTMMDISRTSATIGDDDPTVFFVVVRDGSTCKECIRLHLTPSGEPRLWKFSELKQGYHKRGEENPSAFGLHPHCRCTLTYLSKGFGFKNGQLSYVSEGYDHYERTKPKA